MQHHVVLLICAISLSNLGCEKIRSIASEKIRELRSEEKTPSNAAPSATTGAQLTESTFAEFIAKKETLVVVNFTADWCGACRQLDPVLTRLASEFSGQALLGHVNVDQDRNLALRYRVRALPDVRFFRDGKQVDQFNGAMPENQLRELIAKLTTQGESKQGGIRSLVETLRSATSSEEKPSDSDDPEKPAEPAIRPMEKDWMPPGIQRQ